MGLLGAGIGALGGGLISALGGLFNPAPKYQKATFNNQVDLNELDARAGRSAEDLSKLQLEGTRDAGVMQTSPEQMAVDRTALGNAGGDDISAALSRRSGKRFGNDLSRLKRQADVDSVNRKATQGQQAFDANQAKLKLDMHQDQVAKQAEAEQEAARYSVLSSLMGGVGSMAGAGVAKIMRTPGNATDQAISAGRAAGPMKSPDMLAASSGSIFDRLFASDETRRA